MKARRAQNTVEMALVLPLLALLVAIGIDFARVYHVAASVGQSARVAAEYAATGCRPPLPSPCLPPTAGDVKSKVNDVLPSSLGTSTVTVYDDLGVPYADADTLPAKKWFCVKVRVVFNPITPLAQSFMPGGQELLSRAVLRRNCVLTNNVADCDPYPVTPCP